MPYNYWFEYTSLYWDNTIYLSWNCMVIIGSILGYNMVIFPFFLFPNNLLFLMNACFRFWFSGFDDVCAGTLCYVLHQCSAHSIKGLLRLYPCFVSKLWFYPYFFDFVNLPLLCRSRSTNLPLLRHPPLTVLNFVQKDMNAHAILPLFVMPNCDFTLIWNYRTIL